MEKSNNYAIVLQSTSGGKYPFETMFQLRSKARLGPDGCKDSGYSFISITMNRKELNSNDIEEFKKLFINLCVSVNAFYGYCSEYSMVTQRSIYLAKCAENIFDRKNQPDFGVEISDIYWLNYFGPGYVDFWGKDKITALENAYNVTHDANGGIVVQTTEEPVFADDTVDNISGYEFKQPMYEILGHNTFMHETHQPGKRGENVPTLEQMRSLV